MALKENGEVDRTVFLTETSKILNSSKHPPSPRSTMKLEAAKELLRSKNLSLDLDPTTAPSTV